MKIQLWDRLNMKNLKDSNFWMFIADILLVSLTSGVYYNQLKTFLNWEKRLLLLISSPKAISNSLGNEKRREESFSFSK